MTDDNDRMIPFEYLIGDWKLQYDVPNSDFSEATTGTGNGRFRRILAGKYVTFDYDCSLETGDGAAHAIFAWDDTIHSFRFWWFEDSGAFQQATCQFIKEGTLLLHWHDTLLSQTFEKDDADQVTLRMENPNDSGEYELVMKVILRRV
jgi:hypothetical protein